VERDRWRLVTRDQHDASETILDGDTVYGRWPDPGEDLAHEPWEHWESWEDDPLPRDDVLAEMSHRTTSSPSSKGRPMPSSTRPTLSGESPSPAQEAAPKSQAKAS
jgi:hypothetical protein